MKSDAEQAADLASTSLKAAKEALAEPLTDGKLATINAETDQALVAGQSARYTESEDGFASLEELKAALEAERAARAEAESRSAALVADYRAAASKAAFERALAAELEKQVKLGQGLDDIIMTDKLKL